MPSPARLARLTLEFAIIVAGTATLAHAEVVLAAMLGMWSQ